MLALYVYWWLVNLIPLSIHSRGRAGISESMVWFLKWLEGSIVPYVVCKSGGTEPMLLANTMGSVRKAVGKGCAGRYEVLAIISSSTINSLAVLPAISEEAKEAFKPLRGCL